MAIVDGEDMHSSSVTRSLARHKLQHAKDSANESHKPGDGDEVTIKKMPGGGYHTSAKKHDGTTEEKDHQTYEEAAAHGASHLGHAKPAREKNPKMREEEQPISEPLADESGLAAMGVAETGE